MNENNNKNKVYGPGVRELDLLGQKCLNLNWAKRVWAENGRSNIDHLCRDLKV